MVLHTPMELVNNCTKLKEVLQGEKFKTTKDTATAG